jgi:alkylhydroperoxidase/carboxymuconolactone decarboxylase family protein YurZ
MTSPPHAPLDDRQLAIGPIAAHAAVGYLPALAASLEGGLDAGLTVADAKEILVQLYAYAGFPRALNALSTLMKVLEERRGRGLHDAPGREPGPVPSGRELEALGADNQARLAGGPVSGPVFDFAPAIDRFLKAHLFGDIFGRDHLDWSSRELATVAALSALPGVEPQLLAHVRISLRVGLSAGQLRQFATTLSERVDSDTGQRAVAALDRHLATAAP